MITEQLNPERVERGTYGRNLVENLDAITFFLDHSLHAGDLTSNTLDSGSQFFCNGVFDLAPYTRMGYMPRGTSLTLRRTIGST